MKDYIKTIKKVGFIGFLFLFFFASGAIGANYYVDTAGTDRRGCGDTGYGADACATPQYVINTYSPGRGDTIYIDDGTYNKYGRWKDAFDYVVLIQDMLSGSSGYLTIKARNDNRVIFDMNNKGAGSSAAGLLLFNTAHVKFEGINVTEVGRTGARLSQRTDTGASNDIWFYKCKFYNIGRGYSSTSTENIVSGLLGLNPLTGAISPILVDRCEFHDIGRNRTDIWHDHAIYATGNFKITNSLFYDNYSGSPLYAKKCRGSGFELYNSTVSDANNTNYYRSRFIIETGCNSIKMANNVFIDPPAGYVTYLSKGDNASKFYAYNNVTNAREGGTRDWTGVLRCFTGAGGCPSEGTPFGADVNNKAGVNLSSQITDAAKADFRPTAKALDLINKASANFAQKEDFTGTLRSKTSSDIGAYEYTSQSSSPTNLPDPPKGLKVIEP